MHPAILQVLMNRPIIPSSCRPSLLMMQHGAKRGSVSYSLTNLVSNGDFSGGTTGWENQANASLSASSNILSLTGTGGNAYGGRQDTATAISVGATLFYKALMRTTTGLGGAELTLGLRGSTSGITDSVFAQQNSPVTNTWYTISQIAQTPATWTGVYRLVLLSLGAIGNTGMIIQNQNVMLYNLTTPMGAGNTTTAAEMSDILTQSGETYWDGAKTLLCNPSNKYFDFDYSGNNRPLKMYNFAYTTASGWNGNYLVLDGTDDYLRRVLSAAIADGTAYSAGLVFNIAANKTAMSLHTGSTVAMILGLDASGYVTATTYKTDGTAYTATGNVSYAGKNVMATVVMDTASNLLSLYVNGSFVASAAAAATVRGFSTVSVGRNAADSAYTALSKGMNFLNTKALTGSEVAGYYHGNKKFFGI